MSCSKFLVLSLFLFIGNPSAFGQAQSSVDRVLEHMASVGREFRNLEAEIQRTKVVVIVDDHSTSSGKFYFARNGEKSRVRMNIDTPARQELLIDEGKIHMYFPRIKQVQVVNIGQNQDKVEFMAIGFGQSSADILRYYDVTFVGEELIDGLTTAVLDLKPKFPDLSAIFSNIRLWVDQQRWIPIQTKLTEVGGDYLDVRFANIKINGRLPRNVFDLKLPKDVQIVGRK